MEETSAAVHQRPREGSGDPTSWCLRRALPWTAWSVVFVPVCIVLHELGHLLAARAVGFPHPALHFGGVDPGAAAGLPRAASGIAALAGPVVTAVLALAGCALVRCRARTPWAFALAIAASSRFAVGVPYTVINAVVRLLGGRLTPPAFDEHKAGAALGWSGDLLLAATSLLLALVVWWVGRHLPRGERAAAWMGLLVGTSLGWAVWMLVLGPGILP